MMDSLGSVPECSDVRAFALTRCSSTQAVALAPVPDAVAFSCYFKLYGNRAEKSIALFVLVTTAKAH